MNIIWGGVNAPKVNDAVVRFVGARVSGGERGFGPCTTMGVVNNEILIAGIVYHNYCPETGVIEITGAADTKRWLTRPVLVAMFKYPFEEAGCQMIVMRHPETNAPLRRMWVAAGASEYVIPRLRGKDRAEVITTLTDDIWRSSKMLRGLR